MAGIIAPFVDHGLHVLGQFALEQRLFTRGGMNESDRLGMKGMAWAECETIIDELTVFAEDGAFHDLVSTISVIIE